MTIFKSTSLHLHQVGRVGKAPEVKEINGKTFVEVAVWSAHSRRAGEGYETKYDWMRWTLTGENAAKAVEGVVKGSVVVVDGTLRSSVTENTSGTKQTWWTGYADTFSVLDDAVERSAGRKAEAAAAPRQTPKTSPADDPRMGMYRTETDEEDCPF